MKARELRRILHRLGCVEVRQRGSHLVVRCGTCQTTIPVHAGEDIAPGTLRAIVKALAPCLGEDWLKR
jgi:predicted RNA binding protein YcfA (HicA-like mRNA interferase family)